jgi:hypothetical protein
MQIKNAYVLCHFGSNIKYFELELYFVLMLKANTGPNIDIIYLYSEIDTPIEWVKIMDKYFDKTIGYNDKFILDAFEQSEFKSNYKHFNTLRTCAFLFAYELINYNLICIVESDMVLLNTLDPLFKMKYPATLFINYGLSKNILNTNNLIKYKQNYKNCEKRSNINGGILLFKPNINKLNYAKKEILNVIKNNCINPNEELFLNIETKFNKTIYNIPIIYNYSHYELSKKLNTAPIRNLHFNETKFKYLDIIRSNYVNKFKEKIEIVNFFKSEYYDKYHDLIDSIMDLLK